MEDVVLKDGSSVSIAVVSTVMMLLRDIIESKTPADMMLLYDLAEVAKGEQSVVSAFCTELAYKSGLSDSSGYVHDSVLRIVRSALKSDAKGITLSNPVDLQKTGTEGPQSPDV